jgi:hypothetical protein
LALTSDGVNLHLYLNGRLAKTATAITASPTDVDLKIGGATLIPITASTWNIFAQWHGTSRGPDELGCPDVPTGLPVAFNVRHYKAGAHTNPGETETATPVDGDYIEVEFGGGEVTADCMNAVTPVKRYVIAQLERTRWYDFVLHSRWTQLEGGPGNSVSEVWLDGQQVLGNQTIPISQPTLAWRLSPDMHTTEEYLQFGLYRGPSLDDPPTQLYIDAMRRGNSYSEVAPGQ